MTRRKRARCRSAGAAGRPPGSASSRHRTPQSATILDRIVSHVTVTDPRHALFGNRFAVLTGRSGRGPAYVVVELPDGRRRSIGIRSTDLAEAATTPSPEGPDLPRISVRTLIPLMQHLNANLTLPAEEVIRDGPSSPSRSRCVSTTADSGMPIRPVGGTPSAPMAEPASRDANADRPNGRCADAADAGDPRHAWKGDGSC